ncbi:MAG: hypothetical protein H0U00_14640 [Actinobacteria bacterium]|nr:hypothetical protein [Actinomycetota bacterium]
MTRPTLKGFWREGEWCELVDPDGPPTGRQLLRLNRLGLLQVVEHAVPPLTKGEAAYVIDAAAEVAA